MLCAVKIIDRHPGEQKLLEMAAFLYVGRFDAYVLTYISFLKCWMYCGAHLYRRIFLVNTLQTPLKSTISEGFVYFFFIDYS